MSGRWGFKLKWLIRYLLAAALLFTMIHLFGIESWERLIPSNWWAAAGAALASLGANILGASRWYYSLKTVDQSQSFRFRDIYRLTVTSNIFFEFGLGGYLTLVARPFMLSSQNNNITVTKGALSVIVERAQDIFVFLVLAIPAAAYVSGHLSLEKCLPAITIPIVVIGAVLIIFQKSANKIMVWGFGLVNRLLLLGRGVLDRFFSRLSSASNLGKVSGPVVKIPARFPIVMMFITLLRLALHTTRLQLTALALGFDLPLELFLMGFAVIQFGLLISPTPGGLGVTEWGWLAVLIQFGLSGPEAALASIGIRIYSAVLTVMVFLTGLPLRPKKNGNRINERPFRT